MVREFAILTGVLGVVAIVLMLLPPNRRALAVVLAERGTRRRLLPWALSLTALLAGPFAPVLGVVVLFIVRRHAGLGDPLIDTARLNGVVAVVGGLLLLVLPLVVARFF